MYFRFPTAGICENLFEGTEKALLETVMHHVAFSGEGLFGRISNTSLELV